MKRQLMEIQHEVTEIFNHLHLHPETSWKEVQTTEFIYKFLEKHGGRVTRFSDTTGLVGEIGEGKRCVAIRADMDALWQEVDGVFKANHSCGHDAHMAMVLGVFLLLKKLGHDFSGRVKFIFQPAEEVGMGALKMVEKGVVDDVDVLFGVHLRPVQELPLGKASSAILHGSAQFIQGTIRGEEMHGARPHLGTNAIEVAASIVQHLSVIHVDPRVPHSIKMTKLHAGGDSLNIIPGSASFGIDLRAQTNEVMQEIEEQVGRILQQLAELNGVEITAKKRGWVAAAKENKEAEAIMKEAIGQTLGFQNAVPPLVTTGGDDFHFYTIKRPQLKATMLGLGCDLAPGLHHPNMTFNQEALFHGIEILTRATLLTL
ncbi:M20 peptidase aminoacylase family protein [Pullulanibacillus sp. KACC 23026]|uniref:M20 peptidase aminoacylase family protein n=1 Tax=Pullulanibacillus sp. KACC 23026 TaxID=3028315 RepID=UPI0023B118AF|nr:M20 peptidase aminoacylase family protein [Pullulanibacillus sp. KACC 23026]WEG12966.1 M20 peptidase aminoacylase family protein [Pullulanibacillus sp. KACC 23026]